MALSNNNISISLVRDTLGENKTDIAGLCTSGNINMWSKYKPVRYAHNEPQKVDTEWWKKENCGLEIPSSQDPFSVIEKNWSYNKVRGGSTEPYRLSDFAGYEHKASPFFEIGTSNSIYIDTNNGKYEFKLISKNPTTDSLDISDLTIYSSNLKDSYLSVCIQRVQDGLTGIISAESPLSNTTTGRVIVVNFNTLGSSMQSATYKIGFLLSRNKLKFSDNYLDSFYYSIYKTAQQSNWITATAYPSIKYRYRVSVEGIKNGSSPGNGIWTNLKEADAAAGGTTYIYAVPSIILKCQASNNTSGSTQSISSNTLILNMTDFRGVNQILPYSYDIDKCCFYLLNSDGYGYQSIPINSGETVTFYIVINRPDMSTTNDVPNISTQWRSTFEIRVLLLSNGSESASELVARLNLTT